MKKFLFILFLGLFSCAPKPSQEEVLLGNLGFTEIKKLESVPETVIGPMVSVAMHVEGESPEEDIFNPQGERIGTITSDTVTFNKDLLPVRGVFMSIGPQKETVLSIFTDKVVLFLTDSESVGRFRCETYLLDTKLQITFILK